MKYLSVKFQGRIPKDVPDIDWIRFLTKGNNLKTESARVAFFVCDTLSPYVASSFEVF